MSYILFDSLAVCCAGALCALLGDMRKVVNLGLLAFLALSLALWGRFFFQVFSTPDLLSAAGTFLLAQALLTCSYLAMVLYLNRDASSDAARR